MKQLGLMILGIFCIFLLNGCSDFLEEKSQDEVIPKTVEDYNELLLNYMGYTDIWSVLYVLSDETGIGEKLLRSDTVKMIIGLLKLKVFLPGSRICGKPNQSESIPLTRTRIS